MIGNVCVCVCVCVCVRESVGFSRAVVMAGPVGVAGIWPPGVTVGVTGVRPPGAYPQVTPATQADRQFPASFRSQVFERRSLWQLGSDLVSNAREVAFLADQAVQVCDFVFV